MQTLWSRATKTSCTCRCTFCLSTSTAAIARRASTATARRILRGGPSSTFLYSAIFAAAVVVDGRAKQQRREQWNAAIAAAKEGLNTVKGNTDLEETEHPEQRQEDPELGLVHQVARKDVVTLSDAIDGSTEEHIEELCDSIPLDSRMPNRERPQWRPNTGPRLNRIHLPPQSLWSLDSLRQKTLRDRWTWKKTMTTELSIAKFVHRTVLQLKLYGLSDSSLDALPTAIKSITSLSADDLNLVINEAQVCLHNLREEPIGEIDDIFLSRLARRATFVMPTYAQDEDGTFYGICEEMNDALRALFHQGVSRSSDQTMLAGKICHNLLISPAPPDVQTFNILLTGFNRWQRHDLANLVISSLRETKSRPNELTCAAALSHYIDSNDPPGFVHFVSLMRGHRGGLMLARPDIEITSAGENRLIRKSTSNKVVQKVYPTPMVFNQLMRGVLKFAGIDRAMEIFHEMQRDGWGLDMRGLGQILKDCVNRRDWYNGCVIWEKMQLLTRRHKIVKPDASMYARMLSLCQTTDHDAAYREVLDAAVNNGHDRTSLVRMAARIRSSVDRMNNDSTMLESASQEQNIVRGPGKEPNGKSVAAKVFNYAKDVGSIQSRSDGGTFARLAK